MLPACQPLCRPAAGRHPHLPEGMNHSKGSSPHTPAAEMLTVTGTSYSLGPGPREKGKPAGVSRAHRLRSGAGEGGAVGSISGQPASVREASPAAPCPLGCLGSRAPSARELPPLLEGLETRCECGLQHWGALGQSPSEPASSSGTGTDRHTRSCCRSKDTDEKGQVGARRSDHPQLCCGLSLGLSCYSPGRLLSSLS